MLATFKLPSHYLPLHHHLAPRQINAFINLPWTSPLSRNLCPDVPVLAAPPRLETPPAGPFSNGLSHPFWWIKKLGMAGEIENHWVAEELLERKIEDTLW